MSARFAYKLFSLVVLLSLAFQPLAYAGRQGDEETSGQGNKETSRQGVVAPAPTGLYRTTVTVDSPSRRARLDALGVTVLVDAPGQAVVLADADQLEALARLRFESRGSDDADALVTSHARAKPSLPMAG